jgi:hypothetical protein
MATNENLIDTIETNAQAPKSAEKDGLKAEQHPLPDQIEFDRYQREVGATKARKGLGFTLRRLQPPGSI